MNKAVRDLVKNKFNGVCAYTGKPLDDKWQIDHIQPQCYYRWGISTGDKNDIANLVPAIRIVNHYKRSHTLESFRISMCKFHVRLKKLPKKTRVPRTEKRILYMNQIAQLFDIDIDKPFSGKFYFETI